jgi:hypothetical protein
LPRLRTRNSWLLYRRGRSRWLRPRTPCGQAPPAPTRPAAPATETGTTAEGTTAGAELEEPDDKAAHAWYLWQYDRQREQGVSPKVAEENATKLFAATGTTAEGTTAGTESVYEAPAASLKATETGLPSQPLVQSSTGPWAPNREQEYVRLEPAQFNADANAALDCADAHRGRRFSRGLLTKLHVGGDLSDRYNYISCANMLVQHATSGTDPDRVFLPQRVLKAKTSKSSELTFYTIMEAVGGCDLSGKRWYLLCIERGGKKLVVIEQCKAHLLDLKATPGEWTRCNEIFTFHNRQEALFTKFGDKIVAPSDLADGAISYPKSASGLTSGAFQLEARSRVPPVRFNPQASPAKPKASPKPTEPAKPAKPAASTASSARKRKKTPAKTNKKATATSPPPAFTIDDNKSDSGFDFHDYIRRKPLRPLKKAATELAVTSAAATLLRADLNRLTAAISSFKPSTNAPPSRVEHLNALKDEMQVVTAIMTAQGVVSAQDYRSDAAAAAAAQATQHMAYSQLLVSASQVTSQVLLPPSVAPAPSPRVLWVWCPYCAASLATVDCSRALCCPFCAVSFH